MWWPAPRDLPRLPGARQRTPPRCAASQDAASQAEASTFAKDAISTAAKTSASASVSTSSPAAASTPGTASAPAAAAAAAAATAAAAAAAARDEAPPPPPEKETNEEIDSCHHAARATRVASATPASNATLVSAAKTLSMAARLLFIQDTGGASRTSPGRGFNPDGSSSALHSSEATCSGQPFEDLTSPLPPHVRRCVPYPSSPFVTDQPVVEVSALYRAFVIHICPKRA